MNKRFARIICLLISLLMVTGLVACGTQNGQSTDSSTPASAATTATTAAQPVTLTLMDWDVASDPGSKPFIDSLNAYKAANPQVTITEESLAIEDFETKIKTLAAANELPSVFYIKGSMIANFADNNNIEPVDDMLNNDQEWKNSFMPNSFDDCAYKGKTYGVPFEMSITTVLYYNKNILSECGITDFPTTWDGLKAAIEKIKSKNYIPIAVGDKSNWLAESCILSSLADRFTGTDWFLNIQNKKGSKFTDPDFVSSLTALQELIKAGAFNTDAATIDEDQMKALYYNKKAAMMFEGSWAVSSINSDAPKDVSDATGVAFLPSVTNGKGQQNAVAGGTGGGYGIKSGLSDNEKAAAGLLIKAFTDKNYAQRALDNNSFAPITPSLLDSSKLVPLAVNYQKAVEGRPISPIYDARLSPAIIEVMCNDLQQLFINSKTPADVAKDIQTEYESEQ
jgi:raffinose/stachyose/melibiose transport system substrate-binding protein